MKKLIELIEIVNRNKVKSIEVIGKSSKNDTLIAKLYNAIHDHKIKSDDEALELLYGANADKKAYYKLKHILKERLLNTLFIIDVKHNKYSTRKKAYLECQKIALAINFLSNIGTSRNTVTWLSKKLLTTSKEWGFADIAIVAARKLRSFHSLRSGNRKQMEEYNSILKDYQELYNAELTTEMYYHDLMSYYVNDKSTKTFIAAIADQYIQHLTAVNPKIKSAKFYFQKSMIEVSKYMSINDYETTSKLCETAIENLESLTYKDNGSITGISFQLIACAIHLKKYEEGAKHIERIIPIQEIETFNWFKTYELFINLCLHTKAYNKAGEIFNLISHNKKFKSLPRNILEVWKIFEAWTYFLTQTGHINQNEINTAPKTKFRVSRFLNEMSTFSKDKKGLNIPILVISIALLLFQKRHDLLIERIEAISKYTDRHIRKSDNKRSNAFLRMILEIPKNDFRKSKILSKTDRYYKVLKNTPIEISNQSHDVEILPYEDTWELILGMIK